MADLAGYNHNQSVASATWTIMHGLGTKDVAVDAMIDVSGDLTKAIPLTQVTTDNNNVTITWSVAQSGRARVVGGGDD